MKIRLRAARLLPLTLALLSSTALAVTPAVTLSPTGNHPQGTTQVSGSGFGANEAIDIYFDTTDELLVFANGSGKFTAHTLDVPATASPGTHWISAVERNNGVGAQHDFFVRTRWAEHGFDERGRRNNPYENTVNADNVGNLDLVWSAKTGDQVLSSPAVAQITGPYNPYVFVGSEDDRLYAFDSTGALVWKRATGGPILSSPAIAGTTVYVGSYDEKLYAFKAANGAPAWASPATTGGHIDSSPAVAGGIVYVGSDDAKVYAFNAANGALEWASAAAGNAFDLASPAVVDGVVYAGSFDEKLYAFDAAAGTTLWSFSTGGTIDSSPAVSGGVIYFGSEDANIYALTARTGGEKWAVPTGASVVSSPAVANGVVYIGSEDGKLYALRASNGAVLWTGTLAGGVIFNGAAVANGVVYVGTLSGDVEAFNAGGCGASTCLPLWTATTGDSIESAPAISDGVLYFGSLDTHLYAYALNAGNNPAYAYRKNRQPPSYASLHPDMRLKPVRH